MILGLDRHPAAACFAELDDAITAMRPKDAPPVVLNAHAFPDEIPPGAIVYNLENVGLQVSPNAFGGHAVWDFSTTNFAKWDRAVTHVPIGYHPTMERFTMRPWAERDIDVVFTGNRNLRRVDILQRIRDAGIRLALIGPGEAYGGLRNFILARSKLAISMLQFDDGIHPVLRSAHCVANKLPMVCEMAPETPSWVPLKCRYDNLVKVVGRLLRAPHFLANMADKAYEAFKACPMVLP